MIAALSDLSSDAYSTPTYRRVNCEALVLLGGGRALLMQLAMPGVAAGVDDHSDFRRRPARRLWRTLSLTYRLSFGSASEVAAAAAAINRAHLSVRGRGYSARDVELLRWVFATLVDSAVVAYEAFVRPMSVAEREDYYAGSKWVAPLLGLPVAELPVGFGEFRAYVDRVVARECVVDARARELGARVLRPWWWVPGFAVAPVAEVTAGLLPVGLREAYGLPLPGAWYAGARRWLPRGRRVAPRWLWEVPWARR